MNGLSLTNQFVIRFQQAGSSDFIPGNMDGFFLDDISVKSTNVEFSTLPFQDGFETGELGTSWAWGNPTFPSTTAQSDAVRPSGFVEVVTDINGKDYSIDMKNILASNKKIHKEAYTNPGIYTPSTHIPLPPLLFRSLDIWLPIFCYIIPHISNNVKQIIALSQWFNSSGRHLLVT
mgnify:CR=1 FL=1